MTSLLEIPPLVATSNFLSFRTSHYNINDTRHRHVSKSKQYIRKLKCNRALKRKLKKYKLRQDGQEDQDIIDMSDILVTSLIIRSPNNNNRKTSNHMNDIELLRPKNYLFKMISKKQASSTVKENQYCEIPGDEQNDSCNSSKETKQMNAFKLLMDSRHRIIGSNSSGKDKLIDEILTQEIVENKSIKAKRLIVLQKMAEGKGALKAKELEECKEKNIAKKLEKRADKLKNVLLNPKSKNFNTDKEINNKSKNNIMNFASSTPADNEKKTLKIIDIFAQSEITNSEEINHQKACNEDNFVKKISTIKKKENMLCYVQRIDKKTECDLGITNNNKSIKVKLASKSNKTAKSQKKRLVDQNNATNTEVTVSDDSNICLSENKPLSVKKRNSESISKPNENDAKVNRNTEINDIRPKRNIKKPVKYADQLCLSSSDEELHIFTPKKMKHNDSKTSSDIPKLNTAYEDTKKKLKTTKLKYKLEHKNKDARKPIKLAPIFNKKQQSALLVVETEKKHLDKEFKSQSKTSKLKPNITSEALINFTAVVHVQQKDSAFDQISTKYDDLPEINLDVIIKNETCIDEYPFQNLLDLTDYKWNFTKSCCSKISAREVLHSLKEIKPRFPVYRTYRMLREKRKGNFKGFHSNELDNSKDVISGLPDCDIENPDQLSWSDRYKATTTNEIFGNFDSINELKKWLLSWQENQYKSRNTCHDLDLSDFYHSDTDSEDNFKNVNNLLILKGPVGCGKTSSVYAVATELAIEVIEVNASSKRTGKIMLQDLQEATQSHKVNRGPMSGDNSQKSQELLKDDLKMSKKRGGSKKKSKMSNKLKSIVTPEDFNGYSSSQEISRTNSSLILIDDADIIFDQDDGFSSAIGQLIQSSKRPVILVVSTATNPHLQKFLHHGKILKMNKLSPKMLGIWLDIVSLADTGQCCPGIGAKFLDHFKGDIRKTINVLQFYMCTQPQDINSEAIDSQNINGLHCDSENSSMSWINIEESHNDQTEINITSDSNTNYFWDNFIHRESGLLNYQYPLKIFNIWWSLHSLISNSNEMNDKTDKEISSDRRMLAIANAVDSISLSNYFSSSNKNIYYEDIISQPWTSCETDNVTEQEDFSFYAKSTQTTGEICKELIDKSITQAKRTFKVCSKNYISAPGIINQSETDRIALRHNNLSACLNPSAILDRRALALDYWSSCRTFCKIERGKTDIPNKRKSRFCHYLKSLNMLCSNDSFDKLSESLCFNKY